MTNATADDRYEDLFQAPPRGPAGGVQAPGHRPGLRRRGLAEAERRAIDLEAGLRVVRAVAGELVAPTPIGSAPM